MFTNEKREGIDTLVCVVSLYVSETPKASIPFGIVANSFVGNLSLNSCTYMIKYSKG